MNEFKKLRLHGSLEVAVEVLNRLEWMLRLQDGRSDLFIYAFSNGREQGLAVKSGDPGKQVSIAQYKTTDSIVVYYGKSEEFDFNTNQPDDWGEYTSFPYGDYEGAAAFIYDFLVGEVDNG